MNHYMHQYLVRRLEDEDFDIIKEKASKFNSYYIEEDLDDDSIEEHNHVNLEICDVSDDSLNEIFLPIIKEVNELNHWNFDIGDDIEFKKYKFEIGNFYGWHIDESMWLPESRHDGKMRKISFILSLNESEGDFAGGKHDLITNQHTQFTLSPQEIIVFLSDCPHRISEVTDGRKDLLVGWIKGPPFK